jgi:Flp pilus assembly protein TadG
MLRAWVGNGEAERGSAMVEFAIASTVALTLIFGIIDFGRALYTYHLVSNAARLGSRYAMVRGSACTAPGCPADASQIQTYVRSLSPGIEPSVLAVTTTWSSAYGCVSAANHDQHCLVTVQVTYPFSFIVPLMPNFTLPMTSASVMAISQ